MRYRELVLSKIRLAAASSLLLAVSGLALTGCKTEESDTVVLRVCNWEEYIDLGDWDEEELIELEDGTQILGEGIMYEEFEDWYYETYGQKVKVEYSTFGTCEELYNQLTIGDVYDLASPSEYMIMKMQREGLLVPYSDEFFDKSVEENYYAKGVSPYINQVFDEIQINGNKISQYAAGYMWGTLGIVYNPEFVSEEEAEHWNILLNNNYYKQVNIKDSVRDAYFAATAIATYDEITADDFVNDPDYHNKLSEAINRTDVDTVNQVEDILTQAKNNVYSFETDAGKADMVAGKVYACEQWSGDAVYSMDQADEDGVELCYAAPSEGTNVWFDGWIMLKAGLSEDPRKQHAAEAFVNYLSKPENVIRNMYYIGYTSVIAGGDSDLIYQYIDWSYGADEEEEDPEDLMEYKIGYFFDMDNPDADEEYSILATKEQGRRQLYAQYPTKDVVDRAVVMACFEDEDNERVNRMWTNVRCFDLKSLFK